MARETILQALWRLNKPFPLAILALLVLNLALYGVLTFGVSPRLEALEREYIDLQAMTRQSQQELAAAGTPLAAFRKGQQDLEEFREMIPPRKDLTALVGELFSLAEKAGLTINQVHYSPKEIPEERLLTYALNFSVTGTYRQIKLFVYSLEQSERLIAIERISLSGGGESGQELVSLSLLLSTVFRTEIS